MFKNIFLVKTLPQVSGTDLGEIVVDFVGLFIDGFGESLIRKL